MAVSDGINASVAMPDVNILDVGQFDDYWELVVESPVLNAADMTWPSGAAPSSTDDGVARWALLRQSSVDDLVILGQDQVALRREDTNLFLSGALIALAGSAALAATPDVVLLSRRRPPQLSRPCDRGVGSGRSRPVDRLASPPTRKPAGILKITLLVIGLLSLVGSSRWKRR